MKTLIPKCQTNANNAFGKLKTEFSPDLSWNQTYNKKQLEEGVKTVMDISPKTIRYPNMVFDNSKETEESVYYNGNSKLDQYSPNTIYFGTQYNAHPSQYTETFKPNVIGAHETAHHVDKAMGYPSAKYSKSYNLPTYVGYDSNEYDETNYQNYFNNTLKFDEDFKEEYELVTGKKDFDNITYDQLPTSLKNFIPGDYVSAKKREYNTIVNHDTDLKELWADELSDKVYPGQNFRYNQMHKTKTQ